MRCILLSRIVTYRNAVRSSCARVIRVRHSSTRAAQKINVSRNGAKDVSIEVHEALNQQHADSAILYLPRGPVLQDTQVDDQAVSSLGEILSCHIVRVNYHFSTSDQHPAAIYDVIAALDWTIENLLPARSTPYKGLSDRVGRLGVCGELIGGNLATMLALTECRVGQPGVVAAAISNTVVDWVDIDQSHPSNKASKKAKKIEYFQPTLQQLENARSRLFRRPVDYFDAFASPMMFFRSAGITAPKSKIVESDELFVDHEEATQASTSDGDSNAAEISSRRSRLFPSKSLGLRLPQVLISHGKDSILAKHAKELAQQWKSSITRQRKDRAGLRTRWSSEVYDHDESLGDGSGESIDPDEHKVTVQSYPGTGLFSDAVHGLEVQRASALWLRDKLQQD